MAPTAESKMRDYNEWKKFMDTTEPALDVLSHEIIRRIKARKNPIPRMGNAKWVRNYEPIDVKRLLILLDRELVPILTTKSLPEILQYRAPFPDAKKRHILAFTLADSLLRIKTAG